MFLGRRPVLTPTQEDSMAEVGKDHNPEPLNAEIKMYQATAADSLQLTELRQHAKEDEEYTQAKGHYFEGISIP